MAIVGPFLGSLSNERNLMSNRGTMKSTLPDEALNQIFREARTHSAWLDKPVSDETLRQLYDLMKWGPTSANGSPARFVFLRTREAKERLRPALAPGNVEKTNLGYGDESKLFPRGPRLALNEACTLL